MSLVWDAHPATEEGIGATRFPALRVPGLE
jgi:hypothetical protein